MVEKFCDLALEEKGAATPEQRRDYKTLLQLHQDKNPGGKMQFRQLVGREQLEFKDQPNKDFNGEVNRDHNDNAVSDEIESYDENNEMEVD